MPVYSLLNSIYLKIFYTYLWAKKKQARFMATVRTHGATENQIARLCSVQHLVVSLSQLCQAAAMFHPRHDTLHTWETSSARAARGGSPAQPANR